MTVSDAAGVVTVEHSAIHRERRLRARAHRDYNFVVARRLPVAVLHRRTPRANSACASFVTEYPAENNSAVLDVVRCRVRREPLYLARAKMSVIVT